MSHRNGVEKQCAVCGAGFYVPGSKLERPTCGRVCAGVFRRRPFGIRKKDGYICKDGYRMVRHDGWYIKEHRKKFAEWVGRILTRREVIHHWDENRVNNERENLALFRHQAAHKRLHLFATRHGIAVKDLWFGQDWLTVTP